MKNIKNANNVTKLENLINPQVMADMINESIESQMKFSSLCKIDKVLNGRAGDTVTLPKYSYIGDAVDVEEGESIPISTLVATTEQVSVKKAGKGIELTDEAVLSGYGDTLTESAYQLSLSIANKVDNDVLACLQNISSNMTHDASTSIINSNSISDALVKFGEEVAGDKVILISPEQFAQLRKNEDFLKVTDFGVGMLVTGAVGMIHGCQIIVSDKIVKTNDGKYNNFIVKPEAVAIYLKRETEIEKDRNISTKTTIITADKHYAVHLAYDSRAIKLISKAE